MVPQRGAMTCYSFYGNKTITTGEGGMLCGEFGDAKLWRDGGFDEAYVNIVAGLNYRMSNLQAAVGLAQLERFDDLLEMRLNNARRYAAKLAGRGKWLFVATVRNPKLVQQRLKASGIDSRPVFTPLHLSPAFKCDGSFENSERIWRHGLCLPTGPHLSTEQQKQIVEICQSTLMHP
jgi:perosamine synthetase